jgi:hypothetical protein
MAPSDQPGFEISPTSVGGPAGGGGPVRPGRGRLRIALVVLAALAVPVVAIAGPRIEWRPEIDLSVLRPTPKPVPSPTTLPPATPVPTPTPLPTFMAVAPVPGDLLPIDAGGLRLVNPSTGELGPPANITLYDDAVFHEVGGDGWWCVCFLHEPTDGADSVAVTVRHLDRSLGETGSFAIATYKSAAPPPAQDFGVRLNLERSLDGRIAYLAVGERNRDLWAIHVDVIDLEHGRLLGSSKLTTIRAPLPAAPSPSNGDAPVERYLDGPTVRLSADGRRLLAFATLYPNTETGNPARYAWLIDVAADPSTGPIADVRRLKGAILDQLTSCGLLTWLAPDELLMMCWGATDTGDGATISVRAINLDGRQTGAASFEFDQRSELAEPLVDAANRVVYLWESRTLILHRLDLRLGSSDQVVVDPSTPLPVPVTGPTSGVLPRWTTVTSDFPTNNTPQVVVEPGGTRLYTIGHMPVDPNGSGDWRTGSTGVWVFDISAFALVDHWPAAAAYTSIALSPDGRWLTAIGQAGVDVGGNPAGWSSSVSIHDTSDGRLALQLGELGESEVLTVP